MIAHHLLLAATGSIPFTRPTKWRFESSFSLSVGDSVSVSSSLGTTTGTVEEVGSGYVIVRNASGQTPLWQIVAGRSSATVDGVSVAASQFHSTDAPGMDALGDAVGLYRLPLMVNLGDGLADLQTSDGAVFTETTDSPTGSALSRADNSQFFTADGAGWSGERTLLVLCRLAVAPVPVNLAPWYLSIPSGTTTIALAPWLVTDSKIYSAAAPSGSSLTSSPAPSAGYTYATDVWMLIGAVYRDGAFGPVRNGVVGPTLARTLRTWANVQTHSSWSAAWDVAEVGVWARGLSDAELLEQARRCGVSA